MRALLLENVHPEAATALRAADVEVTEAKGALDDSDLAQALQGVELLGIRSRTQVTSDILKQSPDLLAIGAFCIGTNQIDTEAASELGVAVFNAPFSNTRSVVELAIAEMIALTRRLTEKNESLHAGTWDKSAAGAHEMRGRRLGIVGYGNIGSQLSVLAEGLGMSVVFYDTAEKLALGNARSCESLDELLEIADIVTLHVDGRAGNAGMFGEAQLARMRPGAVFLNLSRGFVVDHQGLAAHITSGHLAGAAIDVFPQEPSRQGDAFQSDLRGLPNVILTPHIGGSTEEAQQDIGRFVAAKLRDFVGTGSTTLSVNLPQIALDQQPGTHRLAHLHTNTPGVLAAVNGVLADHQVNVEGQVLATRGQLGYLLTDIACDYAADVVHALAAMPQTIRLRVLS
ncbi:MAG: D-3-phosphoglycerate dehydrogenase / 2-oxoglutarate reductase [Actinomycetota bacterium]|nr:D-3-phosphoglycerate dehydrogenase / 2-oxoglutarate reductase [Actinomycetota bacterium]MDQ1666915.1 D-3-phosphoglycerate dehydrogenase / 2-oxoglutarate reductase [Actinomycetota bacterium]